MLEMYLPNSPYVAIGSAEMEKRVDEGLSSLKKMDEVCV